MKKEDGDKKSKKLSKDDVDLWKRMTEDIQPMPGAGYQEVEEGSSAEAHNTPPAIRETIAVPKRVNAHQSSFKAKDVDGRTLDRLRKGKTKIEARLDLHGYTQSEAHVALNGFIKNAYNQGKRCVLVVTGKGREGPGVLYQKVPQWLQQGEIGPLVLQSVHATQSDGGKGALYVLLRRRR